MYFLRLLSESKYIFMASILIAFLVPQYAIILKPLIVPALVVMMTVSVKDIRIGNLKNSRMKTVLSLIAVNYLVLGTLYILLGKFFIDQISYQNGLLVLGIMPPAIGIISLSYLFHGDTELGFVTEFIGYMLSVAVIPILSLFLFQESISAYDIIAVLFYVIIVPFLLSRIICFYEKRYRRMSKDIVKSVINLCYAISFYIVIGLNRDTFIHGFASLVPIMLVIIFLKFGLGTSLFVLLKKRLERSLDVLYVLFGTFKNGGAATAIVILLFGVEATVPLAVNSILTPLYILYLEWLLLRNIGPIPS